MRPILCEIPEYLLALIQTLRVKLRHPDFIARHRVRPQDFTRHCPLVFPVLMLLILQKTVKSLQRHLDEFFDQLRQGYLFASVTGGALTHARAKLKHTAFIELDRDCVQPVIYQQTSVRRWHQLRVVGTDSSLTRLPNSEEVGDAFGWVEVRNQNGATGVRYPEGRISVLYDVLNRVGLDARLEPSTLGEVALALQQLEHLQAGDLQLNDRGYTGYIYLASVRKTGAHFASRCSTGSFLTAQQMFRANRAKQSKIVWLYAPPDQKAECLRLGLPTRMTVRFVSLRLPTGELEVLVTSLLDQTLYPTEEFLALYHCRWGHETFYSMLKGRLDLENFTGLAVESVRQDFHAAVFLSNLESLITGPAQAALAERNTPEVLPRQVNRSTSYHALKAEMLDLLYQDIPAERVLAKLLQRFLGAPVAVRPDRKVPRRRKPSFHRSYHFQRRVKKIVF